MDPLIDEAVAAMLSAISSSLPTVSPAPVVTLGALNVAPIGVGGIVGLNADPAGEIAGRRVSGAVSVAVSAADEGALAGALNSTTRAVLALDRTFTASGGILRIAIADVTPQPPAAASVTSVINTQIVFEYLKLPTADSGVITQIPLDLTLGS